MATWRADKTFIPHSMLLPRAAAVGFLGCEWLRQLYSSCRDLSAARIWHRLELSRLSGFDCVEVLKAQYRQANHERARVMAAMAESGYVVWYPRAT